MKTQDVLTKTKWSLDPSHSEIAFKVRHLMITHIRGVFKTFDASIYTNGKDFTTAEIDLWIDAGSILTGNTQRDEHLESAEFFDVTKHKQISFISNSIEKTGKDGNYEVWGNLTMMGISKKIKLLATFGGFAKDNTGVEKAGFTVTGQINRKDWGLSWNTKTIDGGIMVSEEVDISCELELTNLGQKGLVMEMDHQGRHTGNK